MDNTGKSKSTIRTSTLRIWLLALLFITIPAVTFGGEYIIGEGDGLDISVWGVKELNVSVKVRPDGKITIPGLGDTVASGTTPAELQKILADNLKGLVKNPLVTVMVREITNSKVYIFGGGVHSGVFDLNRRTTLLQLLCMIGTTENGGVRTGTPIGDIQRNGADYKKAYLLRNGKKIKENFYDLFITGDTNQDILIESNDAVFIPQLTDNNIYVLGAVNAPRSIEYREGITVMEAILEAGGFNKFAKQNSTSILRKEGTKDIAITVKAKDLIKNGELDQNVRLKPGDYIIASEGIF